MLKIDELKFDAQGLIPAIVVDASSKKVLTLAYMNRESLEISMREGRTCFWSRSDRSCGARAKPAATSSASSRLPPTVTETHWW